MDLLLEEDGNRKSKISSAPGALRKKWRKEIAVFWKRRLYLG